MTFLTAQKFIKNDFQRFLKCYKLKITAITLQRSILSCSALNLRKPV